MNDGFKPPQAGRAFVCRRPSPDQGGVRRLGIVADALRPAGQFIRRQTPGEDSVNEITVRALSHHSQLWPWPFLAHRPPPCSITRRVIQFARVIYD
jgi:hypothetical protein